MRYISMLMAILCLSACSTKTQVKSEVVEKEAEEKKLDGLEKSVFASGCFWCVEAVFESVEGVSEAISGYAGGNASDANYPAVSAGRTDHAEAVEVYYNPEIIDYKTLLVVFFASQDPTTLNRQGPDRGTQYRSAIFYKNDIEKELAEKYIAQLTADKVFSGPITTTLEELTTFYPAEDYHQDFEKRNPNQGYVKAVSVPRLKRFQKKHPELLKKEH